jgi:hypothetical protein
VERSRRRHDASGVGLLPAHPRRRKTTGRSRSTGSSRRCGPPWTTVRTPSTSPFLLSRRRQRRRRTNVLQLLRRGQRWRRGRREQPRLQRLPENPSLFFKKFSSNLSHFCIN